MCICVSHAGIMFNELLQSSTTFFETAPGSLTPIHLILTVQQPFGLCSSTFKMIPTGLVYDQLWTWPTTFSVPRE